MSGRDRSPPAGSDGFDAMIVATAPTRGDEYVVADGEFDSGPRTGYVAVTDLAHPAE